MIQNMSNNKMLLATSFLIMSGCVTGTFLQNGVCLQSDVLSADCHGWRYCSSTGVAGGEAAIQVWGGTIELASSCPQSNQVGNKGLASGWVCCGNTNTNWQDCPANGHSGACVQTDLTSCVQPTNGPNVITVTSCQNWPNQVWYEDNSW